MSYIHCSVCTHPGAHAVIIAEGGSWSKHCPDCQKCQAEIAADNLPEEAE